MNSPVPTLSDTQKTLVSLICAIANADEVIQPAEFETMLDEFSILFALKPADRPALRSQLEMLAKLPLTIESLVLQLKTDAEKELALKLGYTVIQADGQAGEAATINPKEKVAYRTLVDRLALPETVVDQIEWAVDQEFQQAPSLLSLLTTPLHKFFQA
ncbi:MAG: TerB family tellurite resistance protein [Aphanocapsa sp. GSE-SYN-MK-11-07L]|nr:TerB family tellurite resistance protein [Aphanocapsa sp. GSE-SYN-MK-11-07L]